MGHKLHWGISLLIFLAACTPVQAVTKKTQDLPENPSTPTIYATKTATPATIASAQSLNSVSGMIAFYSD